MTTSRVSILLGAAIGLATLAGTTTGALAADLDYGAGSIKDSYAAPPPSSHRTWYFKGFLGMHNQDSDDLTNELYATADFDLVHQDYKSAPFFGIGFGAICNHWLRWDITGEYRGSSVFFAQDINNTFNQTNEYTADIESWVGLANAYVDVFTWRGITPFVGAGIGVASVSVDGLKDVNVPVNSVFYGADNTETNFAWALYAGASYDVTSSVTLELNYRYLNLGDASSGTVTAYDGSSSYASVDLDDVDSHDLMLGMRWKLDHPAPSYMAMK